MTTQDKLLMGSGIVLVAFGAFMTLGGVINFVERPVEHPLGSTLAFLLILGLAPIVCGTVLCRNTRRNTARRQVDDMERTVLRLAARHQGVLTLAEVVTHTSLSLTEAQNVLNQLNLKNVNTMDISDDGVIVYTFPDYPHEATGTQGM